MAYAAGAPPLSERILDAAIEGTFPASDPIAVQDAFASARAREDLCPLVTEADYANLSLLDSPKLRNWLARATRVGSDAMPVEVVTMNSRVVCTELPGGRRRILSVVYPDDADPARGRLSVLTEAGMALLGSSPPQVTEWARPDGTPRRMRIEALVYQPEQDLRSKLIFAP
jgi:regulator of nucleoside diphosphate kinase